MSARVLLLLAAAAFGLCLWAEFVFDDFAIFTARLLTRPLTWTTFRVNALAAGETPVLFHAVNLALHLCCVWLVWDVLSRAIPERAAEIGALIFAVHPLQAGAVDYVWARATLLMTLFCLLAVRDWLRDRRWWAVLWFGVALLAKEECLALPLLFAFLRKRGAWKQIASMFALAFASGAYVLWAANSTAGSQAGAQSIYTPLEYLSSEGLVILRYLQMLVLPVGFTVDPSIPVGWWIAWLAVLLLAAFAWRRRGAGLWFVAGLVLLLPTSSIFPANDLAADRRMYLPMAAFGAGVGLLLERIDKRWIWCLAAVLIGLSIWRSWVWQSNQRLWSEALERAPRKVRPRIQLARVVPPERALELLQDAKKLAPDDALVATDLGRTWLSLGRNAEALAEFGRALALQPNNPTALSNRGVALLMMNQREAARADFERALHIDPCALEPRQNLIQMGVQLPAELRCAAQ